MLTDIRDYLRRRDTVGLRDLSVHFDMDPYAMRELLGVWLRKGRIRRVPVADTGACGGGGSCGGGCSGCAAPGPESERYAWAAPAGDPPEK